jgi:Divergent polysaccharide deacetylase
VLVQCGTTDQIPAFQRAARGRLRCSFLFVFLSALALLAWGCKNEQTKRLSPGQVHVVTREMMHASAGFAKQSTDIAARFEFDGTHPDRVDHLFVTPAGGSEQARRESIAHLIQALDRIGTSHNLTRDEQASSGALLRLNFRSAGVITNSVHILAPATAHSALPPSVQSGQQNGRVRLAIILDDLGNDRAAADAIFALPYPLTVSVLPYHPHSVDIAEEAHRRGYEVMLHLPMQSVGNDMPEAH